MSTNPPAVAPVDADALARELRGRVDGEVRFDDGSRAMYATDASNYRQVPIGVVIPRHVDDVLATVAVRQADDATLVIADGYSCREQIVQSTGRDVLHLAEVLARALPRKGAVP